MTATGTEAKLYQCTKHGEFLPAECFSKDKRNVHRDGLAGWCKKCALKNLRKHQLFQGKIEKEEEKPVEGFTWTVGNYEEQYGHGRQEI